MSLSHDLGTIFRQIFRKLIPRTRTILTAYRLLAYLLVQFVNFRYPVTCGAR